jgi:hypothetical protein
MAKQRFLKTGDVFRLDKGMKAYVNIPERFIYSNRRHSNTLAETNITVGEMQGPFRAKYDTSELIGEYVVIKTEHTGGGTGMGPHDVYPDGHLVHARPVQKRTKQKPISFYQSGCFNAMNENVPVIRNINKPLGKLKYTVVYGEWYSRGSMRGSVTKFDRVETEDLAMLLKNEKYDGNVWFVFEGWPLQEGEEKI